MECDRIKYISAGRIFILSGLIVALIASGCEKMGDLYLGIPLQPKMEEEEFVPGLNILGVLRPDSTGKYNNSFVHVAQILPAVGDTTSDWEITDAMVMVSKTGNIYDSVTGDNASSVFLRMNPDSLFNSPEYRPDSSFWPKAGDRYRISCSSVLLPELQATTTVPSKPVVMQGSLIVSPSRLRFTVLTDSTIHLLDIFLITKDKTYSQRCVPDYLQGKPVEFSFAGHEAVDCIIFAYDKNLSDYYVNSNVSLNFNKYRRPFTYVENGYGVFGSLNLERIRF